MSDPNYNPKLAHRAMLAEIIMYLTIIRRLYQEARKVDLEYTGSGPTNRIFERMESALQRLDVVVSREYDMIVNPDHDSLKS